MDEEEEAVEVEEVSLGFLFVTSPSTIHSPLPCSQHWVALVSAPLQQKESSEHCLIGWSVPVVRRGGLAGVSSFSLSASVADMKLPLLLT